MSKYNIFFILFFTMSCNLESMSDSKNNNKQSSESPQRDPAGDRCDNKCFEDHRALRGSTDFNFLSFKNFGYRGIGRCRGMAIVGQKLGELANFKLSDKKCTDTLDETKCYIEIKNKVRDLIINYKVHSFGGYRNLYEFSSDPEIKNYLKSFVAGTSHRYSASKAVNRYENEFDNKNLSQFSEVLDRVKENKQVYVGISGVYSNQLGYHAVLSYDWANKDGRTVICSRDSNFVFENGENCRNFFFIDQDEVYYQRFEQEAVLLDQFSVTSDEDTRTQRYIDARYSYCVKSLERLKVCN